MNKLDMVRRICADTGYKQTAVEQVIKSLFANIIEALNNGEHVCFSGFGSFEVQKRAPRTGYNMNTGESVHIQERIVPRFNPLFDIDFGDRSCGKDV